MTTPTRLFSRILSLAIQGKLVSNHADDTVDDLLKEIAANNSARKKSKSDPIPDDQIPFQIPDNWKWVRLGEIVINRDSERKPLSSLVRSKQNNKIYDYYGACDIIDKVDGYLFDERLLLVGEDGANLVSRVKPNAFFAEGKYWVNNHAHILDCKIKSVLDYIAIFINSQDLTPYITGSAQPKLNQDNLNKIAIPLPPLSIQSRIVSKLNEIKALVDDCEDIENGMEKDCELLRKKVLDLALRGRLTTQLPSDGDAQTLIDQIEAEKAKSSAKNKKYIPPQPVNPDDAPFQIPDNWKWVRLGEICSKLVDGDHNPPSGINTPNEYIMLSSRNINYNKIVIDGDNVRYLPKDKFDICYQRTALEKGDILFTSVGSLGRSCVYTDDKKYCFQRSVSIIRTYVYNYYLKYCFDSPYYQQLINDNATGTAQMGFYLNQLSKSLIPLPPLAEQSRIVAKIEEVFAQIDNLRV